MYIIYTYNIIIIIYKAYTGKVIMETQCNDMVYGTMYDILHVVWYVIGCYTSWYTVCYRVWCTIIV